MEDQRGEVNSDEQAPKAREELVLQVVQLKLLGEVKGVELVSRWHQRVEHGNEGKGDHEEAGHDPEGDLGTTVPGVHGTAKRDGHGESDREAVVDENADPVLGTKLLHKAGGRHGIDAGQAPQERGCKHGANDKVDVKGPAPRRTAVGKSTSYDGADDAAHAVHDGNAGHIEWALRFRRQNRDVGEDSAVRGSAADACHNPPDDHGIHVGGGAAEGAANLKQYYAGQEEVLDAECAIGYSSVADTILSAIARGLEICARDR